MHLLGFCSLACSLLAAALLPGPRRAPAAATAFESGLGFSDTEPDAGEAKAYAGKEMEEQLRSVSSVDELMTVLYPEYWKMYKCQLRKGGWQHSKEQDNTNTRTGETLKFAAAHYNTEILRSIDNEWRKTQCMPREVCIDVGKEFGAATNTFFKPPCVSVYRCGGCCNSEGQQCMNTSTSYLSKTAYAGKEMEEQLRSVSSVDELMTVLYPEYWKMYKCQLRKGGWQHSKEQDNTNTRTGETLKFAAAHYNTEILRKTLF